MANRVVLGALPGGGYGLRVSRPGFDVMNTGLTGRQTAFDSSWGNTLKLVARGMISIPTGGGTQTVSFGITLSQPMALCVFRTRSNGEWHNSDAVFPSEEYAFAGWSPTSITSTFRLDAVGKLVSIYNNRLVVQNSDTFDRMSYLVAEL